MKVRTSIVLILAFVAGLGCWLIWHLNHAEEKIVRKAVVAEPNGAPNHSTVAAPLATTAGQMTFVVKSPASNREATADKAVAQSASPFRFEIGPADAIGKINDSLLRDAQSGPTSKILGDFNQIHVRQPMLRVDLSPDFILQGGRLEDAKTTLWYVIESSGNAVAGAQVYFDDVGNLGRVQITYPNGEVLIQALDYLAGLDQFHDGSYEACLVVNNLGPDAIWLKSEDGKSDLVYTLGIVKAPLQTEHLYSPSEYMADLQSVLETLLKNAPGPDPGFNPGIKANSKTGQQ